MATPLHTYHALVVDDMKEMRTLIVKALEKVGIECEEASDGVSAANALRRGKLFDVVTVDLSMPRENGHKVMTDILARQSPPMVVAITGVVDPRIVGDLIRRGVTDVIHKPFDFDLLGARIAAFLDYRASQAAAGRHAARQ